MAEEKYGAQVGTRRSLAFRDKISRRSSKSSPLTVFDRNVHSSTSISTKAQPAGVAVTPSAVYVATSAGLEIHPTGGSATSHAGPTSAVAACGDLVAFGSGAKKVILAEMSSGSLKTGAEIEENRGEVLALSFSPDGGLLAAGDVNLPQIT